MYELAIDVLSAAGFEHYEVSNFAQRGFRCRHNENYWLGGEYYGIGPGAASYLAGERRRNHGSTTTYLRRVLGGESPVVEVERIDDNERARERLVFGLRRMDGVCREQFRAATGFDIEQLVGDQLPRLLDQGLLRWNRSRLQLTRRGLLVSDSLWPDML
jgi:oxygen-independent coproporphyrinogen-3 oxidase